MNILIRFTLTLIMAALVALSTGFYVTGYPHSFVLETPPNATPDVSSTAVSLSAAERDLVIAYRREYMKALSGHYRSVEAILEKNAPFGDQTLTHIESLLSLAQFMPEVFPPGTAMTPEEEWGAQPLIWEEPENFSQLIANFQANLETLRTRVSNQQPRQEIMEAYTQVRQSCLDCHSTYRVRKP